MRTQILGYDLGLQQRVAVLDYPKSVSEDQAFHAVRRAAQSLGARPLLGSRRDTVVVLTEASLSWQSLRAAIDVELGREGCRIGVGGICNQAADVPRSYREAQLALQLISIRPPWAFARFVRRARACSRSWPMLRIPTPSSGSCERGSALYLTMTKYGVRNLSALLAPTSKRVRTTSNRLMLSASIATRCAIGCGESVRSQGTTLATRTSSSTSNSHLALGALWLRSSISRKLHHQDPRTVLPVQ